MSSSQTATLLHHLRQWAAGPWDDPHSDRELLQRFTTQRDEAAFATLVRRHGPMVLSVCRRILHQKQDAEDAFQATFLVLFRRVGAHAWRDSVGGWLHRVAARIALRLRAGRTGVSPVRLAEESIAADPLEQLTARELLTAFDEELARLPERYREPLVLCHLEGKTQEETARQLNRSLSTIRRRLERGRKLLHQRLTRRGLELPAALGAVLLAKEASAVVPVTLRIALTQTLNGSVSARVAALAQGTLHAMGMTKLKTAVALVLMLGSFAAGAGLTASRFLAMKPSESETAASAQPKKPATEKAKPTDLYGDPLPPGALLRMGTVRFRHHNVIGNVAYSSDGKILAAAAYGGGIRLYDPTSGKILRQFQAQALQYPAVAFAPDGKTLASVGTRIIQIWDVARGKELHRFAAEAADDNSYYSTIPLVFSPDGKLLASVAPDHSVRIWKAKSGKELVKLRGHQNHVCCLAFSVDGKTLFSASDNREMGGSVFLWRVSTGEALRKFALHQPGAEVEPTPLCFSPDGKTLAFAAGETMKRKQGNITTFLQGQRVGLLDLDTGKVRRKMGPLVGRLKAASFSPDGKIITAMNDERQTGLAISPEEFSRIKGWETDTGKQVFDFPEPNTSSYFWGGGGTLLAFAPDGKKLAAASGSSLHIWELTRGREDLEKPNTHNSQVFCVSFSPDGRTLASASSDHTIALWDAATGKQRQRLRGHEGAVYALAFSPDGKLLASASHNTEQSVRLWAVAAGKEIRRYEIPRLPIGDGSFYSIVTWVAFTANGKVLAACGSDGRILLWDVGTGKELFNQRVPGLPALRKGHEAHFNFTHDPVFTPDGRVLAFSIAQTFYIADVAAGQLLFQFKEDGRMTLALSPDGKTLLCRARKSIWLVETASGKDLHPLDLPDEVIGAAFSPDGRIVAVSAGDAKPIIYLFDVPTGKETLRLRGHEARTPSLAFSPDGTKLASGQWDTTALIWDVASARRKLPRRERTTSELDRLWMDLRDPDAAKAHAALWGFVAAPDRAVPFLKEHLHPVPRVAPDRLRRLIADLDADDFARRETASGELAKLGSEVEPALRKVLEEKPSLEMRRRAEALLSDLTCQTEMTPDALRQWRAIEMLEQIGSSDIRPLLESLSHGAPSAPATREAAAALARLERRSATSP